MHAQRYLYLPYQLARRPLDLVDEKLMHRLPEGTPPRVLFDRVLETVDRIATRILTEQAHASLSVPDRQQSAAPSSAERAATHDTADDARAEARAARVESMKAKQHTDTRSNKNLKTIRQSVARTEAVVEAREHQAEAADHSDAE